SILAPVVFLRQSSRGWAYVCAACYYFAALRDLPLVSRNFFGPTSGLAEGIPLWIIAAGLLSLPWIWAWSPWPIPSLWRCPVALLLSVVPPLGLIGLASPAVAAGLLFPGTGFAGFALTLCVPAMLLNSWEASSVAIASLVLLFHLSADPYPPPPSDWAAVNTRFGLVGHGHADIVREYQVAKQIEAAARCSRARLVILPEAIAPSWIEAIVPNGKTILVGAVEPERKAGGFQAELAALTSSVAIPATPESPTYHNKILVRGAQTADFERRVPIPIGMWKPLTGTGVPLNLSGRGTLVIDGRRAAIIICYEQLIAWPVLASFFEDPSIIVAVSNDVWVSGTAIPQIERNTMRAWAALFHVPVLFAANT
ncbi:MAG: hypothetical protein JO108_28795, partial [Acidobacteriaceae bacterium]|nr:hypothetical protein [Acidobacteriaceae bacterium]